ncbi:nucleoside triphosphate pyrophosphohydrolase [Marinivivus vitaminiproducens]|uniref:nucleoside triphosphate pyrophosphohydrolase n=1 Tax=Marinivivus vitaminiproducens TaxID=3035935 RepID=UPI0027A8CA32|nr:nucleoside triphosphate pyrophosphohydrolase [Geminicoccaceae bacterium SCSIO 64248]
MRSIDRLLAVMARLRDPETGCPWDREQTFASIAPYTIEEAYEVADAIARGDSADLREELGDLLLQVVYHARMAEEEDLFAFEDVAAVIADKMIRRHPHVFGDAAARGTDEQTRAWDEQKAAERAAKAKEGPPSLMDDIPAAMPALTRALKLQKRAARVVLDWPEGAPGVLAKLAEEIAEFEAAAAQADRAREADEIGDLLFTVANLARHRGIDPEQALRDANRKFESRFRHMERSSDTPLASLDAQALDDRWRAAKAAV